MCNYETDHYAGCNCTTPRVLKICPEGDPECPTYGRPYQNPKKGKCPECQAEDLAAVQLPTTNNPRGEKGPPETPVDRHTADSRRGGHAKGASSRSVAAPEPVNTKLRTVTNRQQRAGAITLSYQEMQNSPIFGPQDQAPENAVNAFPLSPLNVRPSALSFTPPSAPPSAEQLESIREVKEQERKEQEKEEQEREEKKRDDESKKKRDSEQKAKDVADGWSIAGPGNNKGK